MAKVPVTLKFTANDYATRAMKSINDALSRLNSSSSKFNERMDKQKEKFKEFSKASKTIGGGLMGAGKAMTAAITLPAVALGGVAVRSAAQFEDAMKELEVRTGASGADLEQMKKLALEMGSTTVFSATEAAEAMTALGKAGFDTKQVLNSASAALNLAGANGMQTSEAAELLTDTLNQFGMKADQANTVADQLSKTADLSSISIMDLRNSLKYAAPFAAEFGIQLNDVSSAIAVLGSQGVKSEMAGTALRSLFTTIAGDAEKIDKLEKKGVSWDQIFTDKTLTKMKSLPEIMEALKKANLSAMERTDIFGKEYGGTIGKLIASQELLGETGKKIADSTGYTAELAGKKADTLNGNLKMLKNQIDVTFINTVEETGVLDLMSDLVEKARDLLDWFSQLDTGTKKMFLAMGAFAAILGPVAFGLGAIVSVLPLILSGLGLILPVLIGFSPWIIAFGLFAVIIYRVADAADALKFAFKALYNESVPYINGLIDAWNSMAKMTGMTIIPRAEGFDMPEGTETKAVSTRSMSISREAAKNIGRNVSPSAPRGFDPSLLVRDPPDAQKNELFVNLGGFIPPGTTVKQGQNNDSDMTLNVGRMGVGAR